MTDPAGPERPVAGPVPLLELGDWRERFGVAAGVTWRGPEPGRPFDLSLPQSPGLVPPGPLRDRWGALQAGLGFPGMVTARQVHGTTVAVHPAGGVEGWHVVEEVDGHITRARGLLLTVVVADCVPLYLIDPEARAIALLHAGWRGTVGGILAIGVQKLVEAAGASVERLIVHCGVSICGSCYEVGPEVLTAVRPGGMADVHGLLDLRAELAAQARGLRVAEVSTSTWCTRHAPARFFSHRGSGGELARMVAYLGLRR